MPNKARGREPSDQDRSERESSAERAAETWTVGSVITEIFTRIKQAYGLEKTGRNG